MSNNDRMEVQESFGDPKQLFISIITFYLLSFFSSWFLILLYLNVPFEPLQILMAWTPNLSALIVVHFVIKEKDGPKNLFRGWKKWRLKPIWYLIGFSPVIMSIIIILISNVLGWTQNPSEINWAYIIFLMIIALFTGATGEELGWRGFLQPHLQQRFSPLVSSILVGFAWAFWHLPLWLTGIWDSNFVLYLLETVALSIIIGWAFNNTDQSVFIASMFHYFVNFSVLIINVATSLGMISTEGNAVLSSIIYSFYAILVVIISILVKNSEKQDV